MNFKTFIGEEINTLIPDLSELRISVFREYPYLYEGNLAYEATYLKRYASASSGFVFAIFDDEQLVGATTALPLTSETDEIRFAFPEKDWNSILYFGESILLPSYRGKGLGKRFFEEREAYAITFPELKRCVFCSVDRPENHPLKPEGYLSHHHFWKKQGYSPLSDTTCTLEWLDLNEKQASEKTLVFWYKDL